MVWVFPHSTTPHHTAGTTALDPFIMGTLHRDKVLLIEPTVCMHITHSEPCDDQGNGLGTHSRGPLLSFLDLQHNTVPKTFKPLIAYVKQGCGSSISFL